MKNILFNSSTPKHNPKHKLEKWFIISGDGVRPYIQKICFVLKSGDGRTYERTKCAKTMIATG